ncbi:MAG TPA: hypothetical protein VLX68_12875 [Chitinivibrionales bacterium]|nr:hypothetical protein [Chitinivibrionales bacterium]
MEEAAIEILKYFRNFQPTPEITFHVAGHKSLENRSEQEVWGVVVTQNSHQRLNTTDDQGIAWGGEVDIRAGYKTDGGILGSKKNFTRF